MKLIILGAIALSSLTGFFVGKKYETSKEELWTTKNDYIVQTD